MMDSEHKQNGGGSAARGDDEAFGRDESAMALRQYFRRRTRAWLRQWWWILALIGLYLLALLAYEVYTNYGLVMIMTDPMNARSHPIYSTWSMLVGSDIPEYTKQLIQYVLLPAGFLAAVKYFAVDGEVTLAFKPRLIFREQMYALRLTFFRLCLTTLIIISLINLASIVSIEIASLSLSPSFASMTLPYFLSGVLAVIVSYFAWSELVLRHFFVKPARSKWIWAAVAAVLIAVYWAYLRPLGLARLAWALGTGLLGGGEFSYSKGGAMLMTDIWLSIGFSELAIAAIALFILRRRNNRMPEGYTGTGEAVS